MVRVHEIRQQFGRTKLFLESPLSVEEVAATAGVKEAHLRQRWRLRSDIRKR